MDVTDLFEPCKNLRTRTFHAAVQQLCSNAFLVKPMLQIVQRRLEAGEHNDLCPSVCLPKLLELADQKPVLGVEIGKTFRHAEV